MRRLKQRLISVILMLAVLMPLSGCSILSDLTTKLGVTTGVIQPSYIEVTAPESTFENKFYYSNYSDTDKEAYREIYQGLMEQSDEFTIHCKEGEIANNILFTVLYDFPEIFWAEGRVVSTAYAKTYVTMKVQYNCTKEEKETKQAQIESAAAKVLQSAPSGTDEYAKIKYVYEYLVNSIDYVDDAPDNQNIYSSLVNKKTVCAGYAKANQYLLGKLGIQCIYVTGDATNAQGTQLHAWNIVLCNGKYYCVDATWGDPIRAEDSQVKESPMNYDYLCCSDENMKSTHVKQAEYAYPECNSNDLNYYIKNGMYYTSVQRKTLLNVMKADIDQKKPYTILKFANAELYEQATKLITEELWSEAAQYLGQKYNIRQVKGYFGEERVYRFVIYWNYK